MISWGVLNVWYFSSFSEIYIYIVCFYKMVADFMEDDRILPF